MRIILQLLLFVFAVSAVSCENDTPEPDNTELPSPVIQGKIYVANEMDGSISVIDASTNKVIKTLQLNSDQKYGLSPHNIQVSPDSKTVWATVVSSSHADEEQIVVINSGNDSVIKWIPMGLHQHVAHLVFSTDGNFVYVTATDGNMVVEIDSKAYKITRTFPFSTPHEPHGMRYFSGKLYIANLKSNNLTIIDLKTNIIKDVAIGGMAVQTAVSPNGKYVFATVYNTREIVRMDINSLEIKRFDLPGASGPIQIYPTPDSKVLYIADQGMLLGRPASQKVFVMNIETGEIMHTITSDVAPHGVVVSKGGEYAYVTNMLGDNVSVIEISTQKIIVKIPVGTAPNGISFWYDGGGMP